MNRPISVMMSLALFLAALATNAGEREDEARQGRDWNLTVGVTVLHFPVYPGADEQRTLLYRGGLASLTVVRALSDNAGTVAIIGAAIATDFGPRLTGSVGVKAHFADKDNLNYDYGVSAAQTLRRAALVESGDARIGEDDLEPYAGGSGLKLARVEAAVRYRMSAQWSLVSFTAVTRVTGDAAKSPLTLRRDTVTAGFNATYRF